MDYTVSISDEEKKALETDMVSIQEWIDNAIHNKARQCIDNIVKEHSEYQPNKISKEQKNRIVREAKLETAKQK